MKLSLNRWLGLQDDDELILSLQKKIKSQQKIIDEYRRQSCQVVKHDLRITEPFQLLKKCGDDQYKKEQHFFNIWKRSFYSVINTLKANNSGIVGENFFMTLCEQINLDIDYNGTKNKNAFDGMYDMKINQYRVEVKTARIGQSKSFQHESLRNSGCDFYVFISILPNHSYITILPKFDMNFRNLIIGVKAHLRKGTSDVFKFTFSEKHLMKAIDKKHSIKITRTTKLTEVETFIKQHIH